MQRNKLVVIIGGLLVVSGLAVGGFFLVKSFWTVTPGEGITTRNSAIIRPNVPAPPIPFTNITTPAGIRFIQFSCSVVSDSL